MIEILVWETTKIGCLTKKRDFLEYFLGHLSFWENYKAWGPSYNLPKNKTKIRPRSTYPKKLDSEARLRNGKVLGTHSAQTEFGLLDSHDLCTPFMHAMNDMLHLWTKLNHTSLFMNGSSSLFFLKNAYLLLWIKIHFDL